MKHYQKSILLSAFTIATMLPNCAWAQGTNDGLGGDDGDIESLYSKVTNIEKKQKALNFYVNFAESFQTEHSSKTDEWTSRFYNKNLRIEMTGWLTDNLYYRFRHRLNKTDAPMGEDNFAKATDYMMVGWKFNDTWSIQGGKKCQALGSFEFDENPMFIYQFSDMEDNVDSSKGALNLLYNPSKTQQFSAEVSNTYNGKLTDEFGENAKVTTGRPGNNRTAGGKKLDIETLEKSNNPLTYSIGWNGKFFDNRLQTRWSYSLRTQAKGKYSRFFRLGQKLNMNKLQWYVDYNNTYDDLDRMKIASKEVVDEMINSTYTQDEINNQDFSNLYLSKVRYQGIVSKMNWQFAKDWNLMLKGMWETASATKNEAFKNYRTAYGYIGSLEYYPARKQKQDLRIFLAYVGRKYDYSKKSGLQDYNTDRIELGLMYRLKAY
ncbi:porin [Segatella copri]|uniref:porin n=1 Tax=Segatella copri TaxID=165179 RepID=UPI00293AFF87|nr:porin [Segatella copri]MDV3112574.1 porin [Segatella copri]